MLTVYLIFENILFDGFSDAIRDIWDGFLDVQNQ